MGLHLAFNVYEIVYYFGTGKDGYGEALKYLP